MALGAELQPGQVVCDITFIYTKLYWYVRLRLISEGLTNSAQAIIGQNRRLMGNFPLATAMRTLLACVQSSLLLLPIINILIEELREAILNWGLASPMRTTVKFKCKLR